MLTHVHTRAALAAALAVALGIVALAGCGGAGKRHASNPPAQPYSKRSTAAGAAAARVERRCQSASSTR